MTVLRVQAETDEGTLEGSAYDEEVTVRIVGDEDGYEPKVGLDRWFNSARITVDPEKEEVTCSVSVGDPRGAFVFEVRRNDRGEIMLHMPYPGEGMPHMRTKKLHDGVLVVVDDKGKPIQFEDEEALEREDGWRDGWGEMEEGRSDPDDDEAPFGIDYSTKKRVWRVVDRSTGRVAKEDDVDDIESAEYAAERAEELNLEALEEEED